MTLVEKIKGIFKPKLTFEQFAVAITSDVRIAIIEELGLMYERSVGCKFKQIKRGVSDRLDREVSRGSLTWHLEKLKDSDLVEEIPTDRPISGFDHIFWDLTSNGREVFKVLEKVKREMEEVES